MAHTDGRAQGRVPGAVYAAFALAGAGNVILGPLIPQLNQRGGVPIGTLALLFPLQFAATAAGAALSTRNLRVSLVAGYGIVALGVAALTLGWPAAAAGMMLVGFGLGLAISGSNLTVARANPLRRAAAISRLNVMWGVGALGVPLLFAFFERSDGAPWALALGAAAASAALASSLSAEPPPVEHPPHAGSRRGLFWPFALLTAELFLYTGGEAAVGGWIIALMAERAGPAGSGANYAGSIFWASLLIGRLAAPSALERVSESLLHRIGLATAAIGTSVIVVWPSAAGIVVGTAVAGFGMAPLFPLIAARLVGFTERHRSRAAGTVFAVGGFGAGALPWLAGAISARSGNLRVAFVVPIAALAGLAVLAALAPRAERPDGASEGAPSPS